MSNKTLHSFRRLMMKNWYTHKKQVESLKNICFRGGHKYLYIYSVLIYIYRYFNLSILFWVYLSKGYNSENLILAFFTFYQFYVMLVIAICSSSLLQFFLLESKSNYVSEAYWIWNPIELKMCIWIFVYRADYHVTRRIL